MKPLIMVTRGLPGSGKSTWAEGLCEILKKTLKVERDEIRLLLFKQLGKLEKEQEEEVTRVQEALIRTHLSLGMNVIISDTNLPDRSVKRWMKLGHEFGIPVVIQDFRHVPLDTVLINNAERGKWSTKFVPEEVIRGMHNRFIKGRDLDKPVEYTPPAELEVVPYVQPVRGQRVFLVDVDGTLAHKHPDRDIYDGSKAHLDFVNKDVAKLVDTLVDAGYYIIVMTGRGAEHRQVTEDWLTAQGIWFDELLCRPEGDTRADYIVKHELFQNHVAPKDYIVSGVLDDRNSVVAMWRKLGLTCFQVADGDF